MTDNNHPITPPPELIVKLASQAVKAADCASDVTVSVATQAARWGADAELKACCEYLARFAYWEPEDIRKIRAARRPKTPSLKERALAALDDAVIRGDCITTSDAVPAIRSALESLPD